MWTVGRFASVVFILCVRFNASETSGFRTEKRNRSVGGHTNSRHLLGLARDLACDDKRQHDALAAEARRMGLVAIVESDHVHVQTP